MRRAIFLADDLEELHGIEFGLAAMFADSVDGGLEEVAGADAGDFDGILEGEEDSLAGPFLGGEVEQIRPS